MISKHNKNKYKFQCFVTAHWCWRWANEWKCESFTGVHTLTSSLGLFVYVDTPLCNTLQATHWWPTHPNSNTLSYLGCGWALQHSYGGYEYLGLEGSCVQYLLGIVRTTCLSLAVVTYII